MPGTNPPLLDLPNPFLTEYGVLRLLEPADADRAALLEQVLDGSYDKPFILDDGAARTLYFSLAFIQSSMRIAAPDELDLVYTQKMMAFLLFQPAPRSMLLLGLGGGSLAKFCHRHFAQAEITVVEYSPHVLAFREQFNIPPDDARFSIVLDDAARFVARPGPRYDVILLDVFDRHGLAGAVSTVDFFDQVRHRLPQRGVLVANLAGEKKHRAQHLDLMRQSFGENILVLPVADEENHIVFAFRDAAFQPRWKWIASQAQTLRDRYNLDFPRFAAKLERSQGSYRRVSSFLRSLRGA